MPEGPEVEKLRGQLEKAWQGRSITGFSAPLSSPNPRKYAKDIEWSQFRSHVEGRKIGEVERYGKFLWVHVDDRGWRIHLSSTGWFTPGNKEAIEALGRPQDPIVNNFIHKINVKNVRVKIHFNDGQIWFYHDPRTWGKWWAPIWQNPRNDPAIAKIGPDWLKKESARETLLTMPHRGSVKDTLCDQEFTAGIGNYLSCEIAWRAKIHPHHKFNDLTKAQKIGLVWATEHCVDSAARFSDHGWWAVFQRKGEKCPTCRTPIAYVKDKGDARGSYYCPTCQVLPG